MPPVGEGCGYLIGGAATPPVGEGRGCLIGQCRYAPVGEGLCALPRATMDGCPYRDIKLRVGLASGLRLLTGNREMNRIGQHRINPANWNLVLRREDRA